MKKVITLVLTNLLVIAAFAQNSNVNKANALKDKGEYAEAKELIDEAVVHEKTMDKGRTWFIRAQIYSDIAISEDEAIRAIDENAINKALESYDKVFELEKEGSTNYTLANLQKDGLYSGLYNKGITAYQEDDFMGAYDNFLHLIEMKPKDTIGYMYAGFSAEAADKSDLALEQYKSAMELDECPIVVYNQAILILDRNEDLEGALEYTEKALTKFPEDADLGRQKISYLIRLERVEEAQGALTDALKIEPDNANLWYSLGYLYSETEDFDKSTEAYAKTVEIQADHTDAMINTAYNYNQQARAVLAKKADLSDDNYDEEAKKLDDEARALYGKAIPSLENAMEYLPDNESILQDLRGLYSVLSMKDKEKAIVEKMKSLGIDTEN